MEKQDNKVILVTWDFTPVSEHALEHAVRISNQTNHTIRLIHIVETGIDPEKKEKVRQKLKEAEEKCFKQFSVRPESVILEGSIFKTIADYAGEIEAVMVVMGTHGIIGMQKLTGSKALKVIVGSKVPFFVVQDKSFTKERYSNIVFPVDFKSESKEKLVWAIYMAKYFDSKIHLFKAPVSDKALSQKINTNINFSVKHLIQNNIEYEIHTAKKNRSMAKETLEFAEEIQADLILVMTTKHINISDYAFGASEQFIIANNAKIPVMCVNPKVSFAKVGQFMYGR